MTPQQTIMWIMYSLPKTELVGSEISDAIADHLRKHTDSTWRADFIIMLSEALLNYRRNPGCWSYLRTAAWALLDEMGIDSDKRFAEFVIIATFAKHDL